VYIDGEFYGGCDIMIGKGCLSFTPLVKHHLRKPCRQHWTNNPKPRSSTRQDSG
jgi:hypothetical protein